MITHYANDSATAEWLRECIADESEGETVRLPALCPEAFEVATMTPAQVQAALEAEFGERVAA
jgi:hypothetical protein